MVRTKRGMNMKIRKVIGSLIAIFLMLVTPISLAMSLPPEQQIYPEEDLSQTDIDYGGNKDLGTSLPCIEQNDTTYYALIVGCSIYEQEKYNIPKPPFNPISTEKMGLLKDSLLKARNWDEENVVFLLNEDATKKRILESLSELSHQITSDDVFFFSWSGHGSQIPDEDGDELLFNASDTHDEVICPYDTYLENETFFNVISDDELEIYFSTIKAKGMCLLFDCCLSGGLSDMRSQSFTISKYPKNSCMKQFTTDFSRDVDGTQPGRIDVNDDTRVVIMSTRPDCIGRASFLTGFMLTTSMAAALSLDFADKNSDGFISAEEAFRVAKPLYALQSGMYWAGIWLSSYFLYKNGILKISYHIPIIKHLYKLPFMKSLVELSEKYPGIFATINTIYNYVYLKEFSKELTGHTAENNANMNDLYSGDLPLIKLP